ncbi:GNAT family N-acetyltransferase [Flavobacterium sediminilitoris]|uniref:GNAT family N-acetyltransferase n=1 Tax=Flavobacterium sediminilitoris TaxID=2024526 RepID=A0ABY4HJF5_9FLAO|nr:MULTISPECIES: GNAT family N-acetyltransferase [Flavobacterium]UOX32985.1 GNAT family N-acetyltransferase [Flavobacterium sediminilitoris]
MDNKIKLEKFNEKDFLYFFQLVNNEKVMEMITERAIEVDEAKIDFEKLIKKNKINEHFGSFKVFNAETNEFIGLAKLEIKEKNSPEVELGYMILPKYWGKGIGNKIGEQLIKIGRNQESIQRIFAIIDPKNLASRKILTNNGFTSKEFKDFDGLPGEILELTL